MNGKCGCDAKVEIDRLRAQVAQCREQTARECIDIMLRESFSINAAVRAIRRKFGVMG